MMTCQVGRGLSVPSLMSYAEVAAELGVSIPTIHNWVRKGRIPEPVEISPVCRRWPVDVIRPVLDRIKSER